MDPIIIAGATIAGRKAIGKASEKIVDSIYNFFKTICGDGFKKWNISRKAADLYKHVHKIRMVKTLWQVDKAVDLLDFYCDLHVLLDKKRTKITSVNDFGGRRKILISGIAGQGKSILLRYLCSQSLCEGLFFPVFIELRKIQSHETLFQHIARFFDVFDITVDEALFRKLIQSNKLILFLDGFDEVPDNNKPHIINEIEQICLLSDELVMIITSRPESSLAMLSVLNTVHLDNLRNGEYKAVIRKLSDDSKFADNLINQVEGHKSQLRELLCTPLLVTLLVMSYKSFQELPAQLSDFYDSIFQILLQRHDGVKPGFKRPRKCSFNDTEYRRVFEALCFESKRKINSIFSYDDICNFGKGALSRMRLDDRQAEKYISDIINVTCLILKEGKDDYRFIHKSVQEYYAAAYIKHTPDAVVQKFYSNCIEHGTTRWGQELRFLQEIDMYRYYKFFSLPLYCNILECTSDTIPEKCPVATLDIARKLYGKMHLIICEQPKIIFNCRTIRIDSFMQDFSAGDFFKLDYTPVIEAINKGVIKLDATQINLKSHPFIADAERAFAINISQILDAGLMTDNIIKITQHLINTSYEIVNKASAFVKHEESVDLSQKLEF